MFDQKRFTLKIIKDKTCLAKRHRSKTLCSKLWIRWRVLENLIFLLQRVNEQLEFYCRHSAEAIAATTTGNLEQIFRSTRESRERRPAIDEYLSYTTIPSLPYQIATHQSIKIV